MHLHGNVQVVPGCCVDIESSELLGNVQHVLFLSSLCTSALSAEMFIDQPYCSLFS